MPHAGFECTIDVRRDTVRPLTNRLVNAMSNQNHLNEQHGRPLASHRHHSGTDCERDIKVRLQTKRRGLHYQH